MSFENLKTALALSELTRAVERRGYKGDNATRVVAHFAPAVRATTDGKIEVPGHLDIDDLLSTRAHELKQFEEAPAPQGMPPLPPGASPEDRILWANEKKRRSDEAEKAARIGLSAS